MKSWVRKAGRRWLVDTGRSKPRIRLRFLSWEEAALKERELRDERKQYGSSGVFSREQRGDIDKALGLLERIGAAPSLSECAEFWIRHNRPHGLRIDLRTLLKDLLKDRSQPVLGRSELYLHSIATTLEPFVAAHEADELSEITPETINEAIRDYKKKDGTPVSPVTQANLYRYLHLLFEFARARGNIPSNPVSLVVNIWEKAKKGRPKILNLVEAQALIDAAVPDPDIFVYVVLGLFCGVRREELLRLSVHNLHDDFRIEITETESKTRGWRTVPLPLVARVMLRDVWEQWEELAELTEPDEKDPRLRLVDPLNFRKRWEKVRRAAGWGRTAAGVKLWPKTCLRHSFASYWYACTKDKPGLLTLLGHNTDAVTFSHYLRPIKVNDPYEYFQLAHDKEVNAELEAALNSEPDKRKALLPA